MQIISNASEDALVDLLPLFLPQASSPSFSPTTPSEVDTFDHVPQRNEGPDERPLPFGWERQLSGTGQIYYINHHRQKTTWEHPLDSHAHEGGSTIEFNHDLPPGWEKRKNAAGRIFFLDHNAGITTWVDPYTDSYTGSPLAPLHRKITYLASHLRRDTQTGDSGQENLWISQDSLWEDSVEAVLNASNGTLMGNLRIKFLDDVVLPFQDWIDILFSELFSPERGLFKSPNESTSQVEINISYLGRNSLRLYTFAGRLHALAIIQQTMFNFSFLPIIYSALEDYDAHGKPTRRKTVDPQSESSENDQLDDSVFLIERAKSLRMEAFMDAFAELVPPHVLRVFTLSEMNVILAAGRQWPVIQTAFLQVPAHLRVDEPASLPSHTSEQLLDELMLKLTGFRIETSQYVEEII